MYKLSTDRGRPEGTFRRERTYRVTSLWPLRLFVIFSGLLVVGQVATAPPRHIGVGGIVASAGLAVFVLAILVWAWVWNDRRGIHVTETGFRCIGATGSRFFAWKDVDGFGMRRSGATWLITVELKNGKRTSLSQGSDWPWEKASVEEIRHQLEGELSEVTTRQNQEMRDVE